MFSDVEIKLKKKNKILFSRDSECLQGLIKLMEIQNRRTLVMWALDCAEITLLQFEEKYPNEPRPRAVLELCQAWARGEIKMPIVLKYGKDDYQKPVSEKIDYYCQRLLYWQENTDKLGYQWAGFLLNESK